VAIYVVTGKLGGGKSLACVDRINEALARGNRVATNLDLELHRLPYVGRYARKVNVLRVPDRPTAADIEAIGYGIEGAQDEASAKRVYDEKKFGVIVFDECGTWFNARDWSEEGRRELVNTLLHIRKKLWHVYLIIQDISMLDKQARKALAQHVVYCRRLDRLTIPFIGFLWQRFTGNKLPLPKVHVAIVKYGDRPDSLTVERWFYTGGALYQAYDTTQVFRADYEHGLFQVVPPWYVFGRARTSWSWVNVMRLTRIHFRKYSLALLLAGGACLGAALTYWRTSEAHAVELVAVQTEAREALEAARTGNEEAGGVAGPEVPVRWYVVEEASTEPGHWSAWFRQGADLYHLDDLGALGMTATRIGPCAYRLNRLEGAAVTARCGRSVPDLQGPARADTLSSYIASMAGP